MRQYLERMYNERADLEGKIRRARRVLSGNPYGMDKRQTELLAGQLEAMEEYLQRLDDRLAYEKTKETEEGR